ADAQARLLLVVSGLADELRGDDSAHARVELDSDFERDLGFDSLARAELLARVEQAFHVRLPVDAFASAATPADLLRALAGAPPSVAPSPAAYRLPAASSLGDTQVPEDART